MEFITRVKKALNWKNITVILLIAIALGFLGYFFGPTIMDFFSDTDRIKDLIHRSGIFGPIIFIILQIAQVILAPIPGNVVGAVGGVIFGWWGLLLTIIGSAVGMAIVVAISRKLGRPFVEKLFSKKQIAKFDFLMDEKGGKLALFLIFLFPFFPDDLVGYLSGLTKIRLRDIILVSTLGRLPMHILTNFFGAQIFEGNWWVILIMLTVVAMFSIVLFLNRGKLFEYVKSKSSTQKLINKKDVIKDKIEDRRSDREEKVINKTEKKPKNDRDK